MRVLNKAGTVLLEVYKADYVDSSPHIQYSYRGPNMAGHGPLESVYRAIDAIRVDYRSARTVGELPEVREI